MWKELKKLSWHIGFNFVHIKGHKKDSNKDHAFWNDICDRACTEMLQMQRPGFLITLRYFFNTKKFEPVAVKLIDKKEEESAGD